jgi:hypothetical protein
MPERRACQLRELTNVPESTRGIGRIELDPPLDVGHETVAQQCQDPDALSILEPIYANPAKVVLINFLQHPDDRITGQTLDEILERNIEGPGRHRPSGPGRQLKRSSHSSLISYDNDSTSNWSRNSRTCERRSAVKLRHIGKHRLNHGASELLSIRGIPFLL